MANNTSSIRDPQGDHDDWIEIYNYGADAIDIGGMYLTDDFSTPDKWLIPNNNPTITTIPSQGYLLIWADNETSEGPLHANFKLGADGEQIGLFGTDGSYLIDSITFGPQVENSSYGRFPDGSNHYQILDTPTPGRPNMYTSIYVLINEITYHPYHPIPGAEDIREEYIELFNRGTEPVNLSGWRFSNGVDFVFPEIILGDGQYLVVAADENTFRARYASVNNVIGGWSGHLSNSGETIELVDSVGVRIDSIRYADEGEWAQRELGPVDRYNHRGWIWLDEHDGGGKSLELINPALPNEYGQNWTASNRNEGTPGALNSTADNDIAPLIVNVTHLPIIPNADDPVEISARIIDEQSTDITATLHYRIDISVYRDEDIYPEYNYNSYNHVIMFDNGTHGDVVAGDGVYCASIPAYHDGAIIEFYIEASDAGANRRTWPAPSIMDRIRQQVTNAFYQVNDTFDGDTFWTPGNQPIYYLIMTEADKDRLLDIGDPAGGEYNSDAQMNATFVSVDGVDVKVRHNLGVRNRGHGSRDDPPNNYRLNFPHDNPWKGVTAVNLNTKYTYYQLAGNFLFRLSGLPQPDVTVVQVRLNGENLAEPGQVMYGSYAHLEVIDSDYAKKHFPEDSAGNAYKCLRDLGPADLQYRGSDPNDYRYSYFKRTNEAQDDWSDLIDLCYVMSETPDDIYVDQVRRVVDVDEWLRFFAVNALLDNSETSLANGYGDDYYLYSGVEDPRFVLIQHDLDTIFGRSGSTTSSIFRSSPIRTIDRFLKHPEFIGRYYFHLKDMIETTFSAEQLGPFLDNLLGDFVPSSQIQDMMDFVAARNGYILSLISSELTLESTLVQSNGYHKSYTNVFSLYGTADPVETRSITVNNQLANWAPVERIWYFGGGRTVAESLISSGSVWKYLDDGSNQGTPSDGTNWFAHPNYNDSYWLEGPSELGYGDASQGRPEATVVYSGPDNDHFITTYFRHTFNVDDASLYSSLYLRLLRDDGAVVYLNGVEIIRSNMPDGDIDYLTHTNNAASSAEESTFLDFSVSADLLSDGTNVLVVEIHQVSGSSSDISFDLELQGIMPPYGTGSLWPGVNRLIVQTFDGPNGMGKELKREHIDIWYDDGDDSEISGTLVTDTTLDAASGPWHVTDDLVVPTGVTLKIEPCTTIFFDPNTKIEIQGRLIAEGKEYKLIRFTRTPWTNDTWNGLQFLDSMNDNRITYAVVEYGRTNDGMIGLENSNLLLDHVTLDNTDLRRIRTIDSSLIVRNSIFTDIFSPGQPPTTNNFNEHIWGRGISENGNFIIENNLLGTSAGHNDAIDFDGPSRPGPIAQIINNIFMGGGDDALDLEADAHIEGNVFMHYHKDIYNNDPGESNVISAGNGKDYVVVRNVFSDIDHVTIIKDDAFMTFVNNTIVDANISAIYFDLEGQTRGPGRGVYVDGCIFQDINLVFDEITDTTDITVNHSIIPAQWHYFGWNNIDADPLFIEPNTDLHLKDISPAIGSGPYGLDMGVYVPSGAAIYGEPDIVTYKTNATLIVGGPGITHYKYRLNNGLWNEERPVDMPINLTNLHNGQSYTVYVIGKNSAGLWQNDDNPTVSWTWTIDTSFSRLVINEVLATNENYGHEGTLPDMIELYYDGPTSLNLSGMSISNNPDDPTMFVFPSGTTISSGEYLVLYADSETTVSGIHLGFELDDKSGSIYLFNSNDLLLDSVQFGQQLPDLSIGRIGYNGNWHLTVPTFGQTNISQQLGNPDTLKINEWFANGDVIYKNDFIEIFNPHDFPVNLGGMYLTDNPVTQSNKFQIDPLSFIDGQDFAVFIADDQNQSGHLNFKLSADGGMIALFDAQFNDIDTIIYEPQMTDVSQGRMPDGTYRFEFLEQPNPGLSNHQQEPQHSP